MFAWYHVCMFRKLGVQAQHNEGGILVHLALTEFFFQTKPQSNVSPSKIVQGVPDRQEGWEDDFTVPKQYSGTVMAALTEGRISSNVRAQMVQDIVTKMMSHCLYPTPFQFETVAQKLVDAYPVLKDSLGPGHVSLYT